jgi:hypothetical protein
LGPALPLKLTRSQLPPAVIYHRQRPNFTDILSSTSCDPIQVLCSTQTAGKQDAFCNWCHLRARCRRCARRRCQRSRGRIVDLHDCSKAYFYCTQSMIQMCLLQANRACSPQNSRRRSSSSSQTTGRTDGSPRTQRRTSRPTTRSGHTSAPGLLRSPLC